MSDEIIAGVRSQINEVLATTLTAEEQVREAVVAYHAEHGVETPWQVVGVTKHRIDDIEYYTVVQVVLLQREDEETVSLTYACHCDLVVHHGDDFVVIDRCSDDEGEPSF